MNEFERALAKTEKREARKTLHIPQVATYEPPLQTLVETPVIKEKRPSLDGIIKVEVTLPYDHFELTFTKMNVMGMKRLSRADFHKALAEGFKPILGTLK